MKNQNKKGFTLVELVIVIAVIAILAGVMIGTFSSVVTSAKQSADYQEIKSRMDEKYYVYIADHKGNTPNCFVFSSSSSSSYSYSYSPLKDSEIEFVYDADLAGITIDDSKITTALSNKTDAKTDAKTGYVKIENKTLGESITLTDGTPSDAGTYLIVEYDKTTAKNKYLMKIENGSDSKKTYYSTYVEVVGDNETTVSLSIKESESGSGNYYSAESVKEK